MNQENPSDRHAKVVSNGRPSGEIGRVDIESRARELALIAGRDEDDIRPEDRRQAERELEGETTPQATTEDAESLGGMTRDPSEPPDLQAGPKPNVAEPNEDADLEHLVLDAVDEAQHAQMIEARKRRQT